MMASHGLVPKAGTQDSYDSLKLKKQKRDRKQNKNVRDEFKSEDIANQDYDLDSVLQVRNHNFEICLTKYMQSFNEVEIQKKGTKNKGGGVKAKHQKRQDEPENETCVELSGEKKKAKKKKKSDKCKEGNTNTIELTPTSKEPTSEAAAEEAENTRLDQQVPKANEVLATFKAKQDPLDGSVVNKDSPASLIITEATTTDEHTNRTGFHSISEVYQNEKTTLTKQLEEEELKLKDQITSDEVLIQSKGKEMSALIDKLDSAEEYKHSKTKELGVIDAKIAGMMGYKLNENGVIHNKTKKDLKNKWCDKMKSEMLVEKENLVKEVKEADETIEKLLRKKQKVDGYLSKMVQESKEQRASIEKRVQFLKENISGQSKEETSGNASSRQPNMQLLESLDNKILSKESELECPVCLEVACAPIFGCDDQHIICSSCRPKVSVCPECREPYPERNRRHRYAEKAAEELAGLMAERDEALRT